MNECIILLSEEPYVSMNYKALIIQYHTEKQVTRVDLALFIRHETDQVPVFIDLQRIQKEAHVWFKTVEERSLVMEGLSGMSLHLPDMDDDEWEEEPVILTIPDSDELPRKQYTRWHDTKWMVMYGLPNCITKHLLNRYFTSSSLAEPEIDRFGQFKSYGMDCQLDEENIYFTTEFANRESTVTAYIECPSHEFVVKVQERLQLAEDQKKVRSKSNRKKLASVGWFNGHRFWVQMADIPKGISRFVRFYNISTETTREDLVEIMKRRKRQSAKTLKEHKLQQMDKLWNPLADIWIQESEHKGHRKKKEADFYRTAEVMAWNWEDANNICEHFKGLPVKGNVVYALWMHQPDTKEYHRVERLEGKTKTIELADMPQDMDKDTIKKALYKRYGAVKELKRVGPRRWRVIMYDVKGAQAVFNGNVSFKGLHVKVGYRSTRKRLSKHKLKQMKWKKKNNTLSKADCKILVKIEERKKRKRKNKSNLKRG